MCKVMDAAMIMVNKSIKMAEEKKNTAYLLDYVAVHKLLFLCQHKMLYKYGKSMFDEEIYAHECGPYADGLTFLLLERGSGPIRKPFEEKDIVPTTYIRQVVMEAILEEYGGLSTEEIVRTVKNSYLYAELASDISEEFKPPILKSRMKDTEDATIMREGIDAYIQERVPELPKQ